MPSSAANAEPTLPAMIMQVMTGVSSLDRARARTPPTDLVNPSLANSLINWMVNTIPTNADVKRHTPNDLGPTRLSCSNVFFQWILPCNMRTMASPPKTSAAILLHMYLGGFQDMM